MKSIIDVTVGQAKTDPDFVHIPVMMHAAVDDDDTDEETIPSVMAVWMTVSLRHRSLQGSMEAISDTVDDCLKQYTGDWSATGLLLVKDKIMKSIEKNNVRRLSQDWFTDPESATRH